MLRLSTSVALWCAGVVVCAPLAHAVAPDADAGAWVRLLTPLTSTAPVGTAVTARGLPVLAGASLAGCRIAGTIAESATRGGRRLLRVTFTSVSADGAAMPIALQVDAVDNARETVDADGRIVGLQRIRRRPSRLEDVLLLMAHAHPLLAVSEEGARLLLRAGEHPGIAYPPGIDVHVRPTGAAVWPPAACVPPAPPPPLALEGATPPPPAWPRRSQTGDGVRPADWINVAFVGTSGDLQAAFSRAGWLPADATSWRADAGTFVAVVARHGYATGPVSRLTLDGVPPAFVFQRSTNTFAARHHVRVWASAARVDGAPVWLAAATHDIAIEFSSETHRITHRIDGAIDDERNRLAAALVDAGAVDAFSAVERPAVDRTSVNAAGDAVTTDGRLIVLRLAPARD